MDKKLKVFAWLLLIGGIGGLLWSVLFATIATNNCVADFGGGPCISRQVPMDNYLTSVYLLINSSLAILAGVLLLIAAGTKRSFIGKAGVGTVVVLVLSSVASILIPSGVESGTNLFVFIISMATNPVIGVFEGLFLCGLFLNAVSIYSWLKLFRDPSGVPKIALPKT